MAGRNRFDGRASASDGAAIPFDRPAKHVGRAAKQVGPAASRRLTCRRKFRSGRMGCSRRFGCGRDLFALFCDIRSLKTLLGISSSPMIKAVLLSLLVAASVHAANIPEPAVGSAEQAIARFQQLRDTELKASLTPSQLRAVLSSQHAWSIDVLLLHHPDYAASHRVDPLEPHGASADPLRFVGSFAAAASTEAPTWCLSYTSGLMGGGVTVYLDAITGKILYLCMIPSE